MSEESLKAFDPEDPGDIIAELFRKRVIQMAIEASKVTLYREMSPQDRLRYFIAGALTGIFGVAFAGIKSDGYDAMAEYIEACLPFARQQAEGMRGPNGEALVNHHDDGKGSQSHG